MGLFGRKKEQETGGGAQPMPRPAAAESGVKVLGSGCAKCSALEAAAREALAELGMDTAVGHVTGYAEIAAYGVMSTPALVVDGRVVSFGKVLKKEEVMALLKQCRG